MVPFESITNHLGSPVLFEIPFRMLSGRGWAGQAYAAIDQGANAADVGAIVFGIGVSGALGKLTSQRESSPAEKRDRLKYGVY